MKDYVNFLKKYLHFNEEALNWCLAFTVYLHVADDLVDNPVVDKQYVTKFIEIAPKIFTAPFYVRNSETLYPLICSGSLDYYVSVMFEGSKELWKKERSDTLRSSINNVFLAIIEIVAGYDAKRQAALELQEISYYTHHDENGSPI